MNNPKISVIIPCYSLERFDDTIEAINSALDQTYTPYEVIVSVDHNKELFQKLSKTFSNPVILVLNENDHGAAGTRNFGISAATGDFVAFIDDDSLADKTWLQNLLPKLLEENILGVGGKVTLLWKRDKPPLWFPEEFDFMYGGTEHKKLAVLPNGEIRNVNENNAAFKSVLFQQVGLMEAKLGRCYDTSIVFNAVGGEGAEFCLRLKARYPDKLLVFVPQAMTYHKVDNRDTISYMLKYAFREGITRALLKKLVAHKQNNALAAENIFLKRLVLKSLPHRLIRFYKPSNVAQTFMIIANLTLIFFGYCYGRVKFSMEQ